MKFGDGIGLEGEFTHGGCASLMQDGFLGNQSGCREAQNWYVGHAAIRQTTLSGFIACRKVHVPATDRIPVIAHSTVSILEGRSTATYGRT